MIRTILIVLLAMAIFIPAVQAQDSFESTICASGISTVIHSSKELMVMGFELKGIARSNTNSEIYNNASEPLSWQDKF